MLSYLLAILCLIVPSVFLIGTPSWKTSSVYEKLIIFSLAAWTLTYFFSIHMSVQFFCGFGVFAVTYAIKEHYFHVKHKWIYLFFAYFLWNAISLIWTPDRLQGLTELRVYLLFVVIPLMFCCIRLSSSAKQTVLTSVHRALWLYMAASFATWIIFCLTNNISPSEWFLMQKRTFLDQNPYDIVFNWSNYHHPTYISMGLLSVAAIGLITSKKHPTKETLCHIETVLFALAVLFLCVLVQSRITFLSWIAIMPLIAIYKTRSHKYIAATIIAITILAAATAFTLQYDKIIHFVDDPVRQQNLKTAVYCIHENPIWGSGIEAIRSQMDSDEIAQKLGYPYANKDLANPHHQFIGDWMQTGIVGMILSLSIFLCIFAHAIRHKNIELLSFMFIFTMLSNIEMPFYLHKGTIMFLLFTGLLTSDYDTNQRERSNSSHT